MVLLTFFFVLICFSSIRLKLNMFCVLKQNVTITSIVFSCQAHDDFISVADACKEKIHVYFNCGVVHTGTIFDSASTNELLNGGSAKCHY